MRTCPIELHSLADMRRVFDTNVFGSVYLTQCAIPLLKESKGRIINVTSLAGKVAPPLQGTYSASKHAFEGNGCYCQLQFRTTLLLCALLYLCYHSSLPHLHTAPHHLYVANVLIALGYSDALRRELGSQFGISVSIVEPAYVVSNLQATATATSQISSTTAAAPQSVECIDHSKGVTEEEMKAMYSQQYNSHNSDDVVHNVGLANSPDVTTWAITVGAVASSTNT